MALVTFATFADILAYSIAVPVLPDIGRRFGASPTVIGLLFASFGLTVLLTSIPMGAWSDRTGRRVPLVGGMLLLAVASVLFAFAPSMPWLFAARLAQGAADAITWVVGFAVVADLYSTEDRGRVMGLVMSGSTGAFLLGPSVGGWLYELGGAHVPYLAVGVLAAVAALGLAAIDLPAPTPRPPLRLRSLTSAPAVVICATAVIVGGGTIAMLEPVMSLEFSSVLGLGPGRIGLVFGAAAVVGAILHPVFGRLADRVTGRRLTLAGLGALGLTMPALALIGSFTSAIAIYGGFVVSISMMVAPSLAFMADAISEADRGTADGTPSFGVAYGVYNFAWALGLLVGPSVGAALYERIGLTPLLLGWAPCVAVIALWLARRGPGGARHVR